MSGIDDFAHIVATAVSTRYFPRLELSLRALCASVREERFPVNNLKDIDFDTLLQLAFSESTPLACRRYIAILTNFVITTNTLASQLDASEVAKEACTRLLVAQANETICVTAGNTLRALLKNTRILPALLEVPSDNDSTMGVPMCLKTIADLLCSTQSCLCCEAWLTFNELLFGNRQTSARVIANCLPWMLRLSVDCIRSRNYVARRQMLRILTALVTVREYAKCRGTLLQSPALLCAVMDSLNDPSEHIQYEAHHALKVFVAYPHKSLGVRHILSINRELLASHFSGFLSGDPSVDQQINAERAVLLRHLANLQPLDENEELVLLC